MIRAEGKAAVQKLVDQAQPMVQLLWQNQIEGRDFDSPERKAALDKALREKISRIGDPSIRSHYGQAIKDLRWELFNPRRTAAPTARRSGGRWVPPPAPAMPSTKSSLLVAAGDDAQTQMRLLVILTSLVATPSVCEEFETPLENLDCKDATQSRLRDLILRHADAGAETLRAHIADEMGEDALEKLMSLPHVALAPPVRFPGNEELARQTVAQELAKIEAERGLDAEITEAAEDIIGVADEAVTWRLSQAAEAHNRAIRSQQEDREEYDLGDNGARINRGEREKFDALLDKIGFSKPDR